jgi:formylmethanofuran dehydrogenase subunit E
MAVCAPGDKILCYLKDGKIVSVYETGSIAKEIFEIICLYEEGYLIYVPDDIHLLDAIHIDSGNYKYYNLDMKYIDSSVYYISDYKIAGIHDRIDGMRCRKCKDFFPMAEPNMENGTLLCWQCRKYPIYN